MLTPNELMDDYKILGEEKYAFFLLACKISAKSVHTAERLTGNDNFECADPGLVKKGPTACGEHQTPVGKLLQRQKIDYMTLLYDYENPKLELLRYHFCFYLRRKFQLGRLQKSEYCAYCSNR